jgi:hypothetical protein
MRKLPVLDVTPEDIKAMLDRIKPVVSEDDFNLVRALVETFEQATEVLRNGRATLNRIRRLFGLGQSEKTATLRADAAKAASTIATTPEPHGLDATDNDLALPSTTTTTDPATPPPSPKNHPENKRKGHGRVPASAYLGAAHVAVAHESLRRGDPCPDCIKGTVYPVRSTPVVRIVGQPPLAATCWHCQRFRCSTCGKLFTAHLPPEGQGEKYDETAASMFAVLHCGTGVPFHRLERLQANLNTPVPASTQWEIIEQRIPLVEPAYNELARLAAQAELLHNDDSHMRILSLMGKRRAALVASGKLDTPERTGVFTTAVIAVVASLGVIALFFTGRKHAGENLAALLKQRDPALPAPLLMSDALSRNLPDGHKVIESNCLAHGRRNVADEMPNFPNECLVLLDQLALVYKLDNECKQQRLSDGERLLAHQRQSAPIMEALKKWMTAQFDEKLVEPNSGLGQAFNYFLKRWDKFTVFLRIPGAPLDNNICERALKMAIKLRKASLFYRSERGARVGDIYMTLIHTAELHGQNPLDYLTELQRNHKAVAETPADWLPWNYKASLARIRHTHAVPSRVAA